jgi:uncharacterized protein (DUF433 family)
MEHALTLGPVMHSIPDRITVDPETCGGRPCIRGLRVRVKDILDMLAGGCTRADILRDYPYLENEDITAALEFASRATDHPALAASDQ